MSPTQSAHSRHGFTVVEVLVIAPVVLLTIAAFVGVLIGLTGEVLVARSNNSLAYDAQSGLSMIEQDVRRSGSFLATNNLTVTAPQGQNNTSTAFQNALNNSNPQGVALILNMVAISGSTNPATTTPVWLRDNPHPCTDDRRRNNQVMTYNVVYFVDGNGTMWRRVIMPSNYASAGCTSPDQRPSCAPGRTETICVGRDARVLDNVTSLAIQYFPTADSTTAVPSVSNPATATSVRTALLNGGTTGMVSAQIDITSAKSVAGRDVTYSSSVRATRAGTLNRD